MTENFSQIKCETPKYRSKNSKQDKCKTNQRTKQPNPAPRHIIFKLQKIKHKEKVHEEVKGKEKIFYLYRKKESHLNFPQKTCKKEESKTFKVSEKKIQPILLYHEKLFFKIEREIKTFSNNKN